MTERNFSRPDGGAGSNGRGRRVDWPGYAGRTQPGSSRIPGNNQDSGPDARTVLTPPPGLEQAYDAQAMVVALGIQKAMDDAHIRELVQSMLDNVARATIKVVSPPWWQAKPFFGVSFGGNVMQTVAAAPQDFTTATDGTTTLSYTTPDGYGAVLKKIWMGAQSAADWSSLCWQITLNSIPQFPWNNMCCGYGTLQFPRDLQLIVPPASIVEFKVKNTSAAAIAYVQSGCEGHAVSLGVAGWNNAHDIGASVA